MIKKILVAVIFLLVGLIIYAAVLPAAYLIKRDVTINATPEIVYPYLVSTRKADMWMPWKEIDSKVKNTYSGPAEGVGSTSSWESSGQMGVGKAEITEAVPNQSVKVKITYTKPMEMSQNSEFILTPKDSQTTMTWTVTGESPFIARLMCILTFRNMDSYVGGMFEQGLNKLKVMIEGTK
ncbi:MAG: hypothetical protein A2622_04175 [Bdellovibrionales bacterium RIFCSPHIGHO2_01_FULL_40_29]|nr:MAG: hypothetical protein A2622_04175 [Bdellovibrionales bacterium RIFCSPHIGHO2_01_FULL_40_29]OFZ34865.1 MAG: hypothetical protein A3D17_11200 [Bdellovibrionales bacterium RIFCSPHIGHO2_02_FULL_40_15]